jgi:hypothetical protein
MASAWANLSRAKGISNKSIPIPVAWEPCPGNTHAVFVIGQLSFVIGQLSLVIGHWLLRELQEINYLILWDGHLARPLVLAGKMPAPQENLVYLLTGKFFVSQLNK